MMAWKKSQPLLQNKVRQRRLGKAVALIKTVSGNH